MGRGAVSSLAGRWMCQICPNGYLSQLPESAWGWGLSWHRCLSSELSMTGCLSRIHCCHSRSRFAAVPLPLERNVTQWRCGKRALSAPSWPCSPLTALPANWKCCYYPRSKAPSKHPLRNMLLPLPMGLGMPGDSGDAPCPLMPGLMLPVVTDCHLV